MRVREQGDPALLPKHGGKGMFGHHVHVAVLEAREKESGCTVHVVDEEFDHGEAVLQRKVPVFPQDTAETLAARVLEEEHKLYPEAIGLYSRSGYREIPRYAPYENVALSVCFAKDLN